MISIGTELETKLAALAQRTPAATPFLTVYLDTRADGHGHDNFGIFLRKELKRRGRTYQDGSAARVSYDADSARVQRFVAEELRPAANGVALFACHGEGFFETIQLEAPIDRHRIHVGTLPHLFPLAHLLDEYRPAAALVTDGHAARIWVFALGAVRRQERVENPKLNRSMVGGWSQARFQRHGDDQNLHHAKDVAEALERVVREDNPEKIFLAGEGSMLPVVRRYLSKQVTERLVDLPHVDMATPEHEVLRQTLTAFRDEDAKDDAEHVERLLDEYRGGGLAVVGPRQTRRALENGQVDVLYLSAALEHVAEPGDCEDGEAADEPQLADELLVLAKQTSARVRMLEEPALLAGYGGVAALLRYKINGGPSS